MILSSNIHFEDTKFTEDDDDEEDWKEDNERSNCNDLFYIIKSSFKTMYGENTEGSYLRHHSKSSQQKNAEQKKIPQGAYKILLNFTLKPHILNIETIILF